MMPNIKAKVLCELDEHVLGAFQEGSLNQKAYLVDARQGNEESPCKHDSW